MTKLITVQRCLEILEECHETTADPDCKAALKWARNCIESELAESPPAITAEDCVGLLGEMQAREEKEHNELFGNASAPASSGYISGIDDSRRAIKTALRTNTPGGRWVSEGEMRGCQMDWCERCAMVDDWQAGEVAPLPCLECRVPRPTKYKPRREP